MTPRLGIKHEYRRILRFQSYFTPNYARSSHGRIQSGARNSEITLKQLGIVLIYQVKKAEIFETLSCSLVFVFLYLALILLFAHCLISCTCI